jgi:Txe/YoeB family toxin of toxin-antitoxin system
MKLLWSEWPGGITNTGRKLIRTRSIGSKRDDTVFGETRSKGLGKPEPLRGDFSSWWSRRMSGDHRIVYRAHGMDDEQRVEIVACRYRYRHADDSWAL